MRYLSFYFALLSCFLLSCATPRILLQAPEPSPTIIRLDSVGQLTSGKIKFKGPVTVQVGQGNTASTTKTDNTGRAASTGANGGTSQPVTTNKTPVWALGLLGVVALGVGFWAGGKIWPRARVAIMALLLLLPLASEASTPEPPHYSYKEARRVERRYNRVRRYYKRVNRRTTAELQRQQIRGLKRGHP